jgi:hypothetical protein
MQSRLESVYSVQRGIYDGDGRCGYYRFSDGSYRGFRVSVNVERIVAGGDGRAGRRHGMSG